MKLGARLKEARAGKASQLEIAELLYTTQQQISKYETGKQLMGIDKYIKLAEFYNISIDYLVGIIDTPKKLH